MRESQLSQTFEASVAELFDRAVGDASLETKFLNLTKKADIDVSEWTHQDERSTRVISYVIQATNCPFLKTLAKGADVTANKFQDVQTDNEKTEVVIDSKIFFGQAPVVAHIKVVLRQLEPTSTQCTITVTNTCNNTLLRDKMEAQMEEESTRDMKLWMELLWESYTAHKALEERRKREEATAALLSSSPAAQVPLSRPITQKSYSWSSHDLQELGEREEIKVLNTGMATLSDDIESLRRTVESHYLRLCSLETSLSSQSSTTQPSDTPSTSTLGATGRANPQLETLSTSSPAQKALLATTTPTQQTPGLAFNSLAELEVRQKALRAQLTSQMQSIEKSFLKHQQASQHIKVLESRWEIMLDKMNRQLQDIDTLRFGVLASWRQWLSFIGFVILWPLIVRYAWKLFSKRIVAYIFLPLSRFWKSRRAAKAVTSRAKSLVPAAAASQFPATAASASAATVSAIATSIAESSNSHPVLSRLAPRSFWKR